MRKIFTLVAASIAALANAGTFTVSAPSWYGALPVLNYDPSAPFYEDAYANLSGSTVNFGASISLNASASYLRTVGVAGSVQWKIGWSPSFPGETPPASAPVTFVATGKNKIAAYTNAYGSGSIARSDISIHNASLASLPMVSISGTAAQSGGSDPNTLTNTWSTDGAHWAQFSNVNGEWVAYIGYGINEHIFVNTVVNQSGGFAYSGNVASFDVSLKLIKVGNQAIP